MTDTFWDNLEIPVDHIGQMKQEAYVCIVVTQDKKTDQGRHKTFDVWTPHWSLKKEWNSTVWPQFLIILMSEWLIERYTSAHA